jgi:hypothetical protein
LSTSRLARNSEVRGNLIEYAGRKPGKLAGTEVLDLAALMKSLVLCRLCRMKFDHKRHGYIRTTRWGWVGGKCDGCAEMSMQNYFYVHEKLENEVYSP